jgi:uncharacterized protein (UPF0335 family)
MTDEQIPMGGNSVAVAGDRIKSFLERVEKLEEEKASIAGDIKDVFAEAKGNGFDTKVLRELLRIRKQDHAERQEHNALLRLYGDAIGVTVFD